MVCIFRSFLLGLGVPIFQRTTLAVFRIQQTWIFFFPGSQDEGLELYYCECRCRPRAYLSSPLGQAVFCSQQTASAFALNHVSLFFRSDPPPNSLPSNIPENSVKTGLLNPPYQLSIVLRLLTGDGSRSDHNETGHDYW
jgi:hypothetical protein